ncbi:nucleolar complex protein 3, partial [Trifolium medium]|nr:nucleolar complex protein 3 [Trifolium medium]
MATGISSMSTGQNQVLLSKSSPQQAFKEMSIYQELCFEQSGSIKLNNKKRRLNGNAT